MKNQISMPEFDRAINKIFKYDDVFNFIEVGCLDAKDSIFFKNKYKNCNSYAIEGLPSNFEEYLRNISEVKCFNTIIHEYDGFVDFYIKNINGLHGIFNRGDLYGKNILTNQPCKTIKTFAFENNISALDVLKIDVEGATLQVLKGSKELIDTIKIMHIETEDTCFFQGQDVHDQVVDLLKNKFEMIDISKVTIQTNQHQFDSIWVNKKL